MIEYVEWPMLAHNKCFSLEQNGMTVTGVILEGESGERATVDRFGRVQWFTVNESGEMIPEKTKAGD